MILANKILRSNILKVVTFMIVLLSCSTNKGTINSYIEPTYTKGSINKIAVLSIRNARFAPSESRTINKRIIQSLIAKNPNLEIVSPSEALRKINESEFADKWADFVEDYYTSGIPNRKILNEISKILNVDAILQGQMINVQQIDGNGWNVKGQTRVTISFSIIETKSAKTIWEVTSDGIRRNALELNPAPPVSEAVSLAIDKVSANMPIL